MLFATIRWLILHKCRGNSVSEESLELSEDIKVKIMAKEKKSFYDLKNVFVMFCWSSCSNI